MSILIATPCFGGQQFEPYAASMMLLKKELDVAGLPHDVMTITKESLITRARDVIAASFLRETDYECLLFIDADIEFCPGDVAALWNLCWPGVSSPADVAVGCYRNKSPEAGRTAWVGGELREVSDFKEPFEVDRAGTGFMMIRRQTFERLRTANPDWEYEEGFPEQKWNGERGKAWAFFQDPIVKWEDGSRYHLSEDYFFCHEVRKHGMRVIMDPDIHLKHWGLFPY